MAGAIAKEMNAWGNEAVYVEEFFKCSFLFAAEYGPHLVLLDITLPFIMDTTGAARSVRYRACR